MFGRRKNTIPSAQEALPGRAARLPVPEQHFVNAARLEPPFPDGMELGLFGLGCFWGAERKFWEAKGVFSTAVGYAGGRRHRRRHLRPRRLRPLVQQPPHDRRVVPASQQFVLGPEPTAAT